MIYYLLFGITYAFAAVVQPGPFQVFLLDQTLIKGWKRTIPAAFGPLISDLPVIVITLLLLNTVPHKMISLLQAAGGLFLLYLAAGSFKDWKKNIPVQQAVSHSGQETLLKAVLVNLLNPNPYIGWSLILGPLLIKGWHINPINGIVLIAAFYITLIAGMIITIIIFGTTGNLSPKINRLLKGLTTIALACFGLFELWQGLTAYFG